MFCKNPFNFLKNSTRVCIMSTNKSTHKRKKNKRRSAYVYLCLLLLPFFVSTAPHMRFTQNSIRRLGGTHFIRGMSRDLIKKKQLAQSRNVMTSTARNQVYFSEPDNIQNKIIDLINNETEEILIMMYQITDKGIADALIAAAKKPTVKVHLIVDKEAARNEHSRVNYLRKNGVTVLPIRGRNGGLMHNKVLIFKNNSSALANGQGSIVLTGSFNCTRGARLKNHENVMMLTESRVVKKFLHEFRRLKEVTKRKKNSKKK